MYIYMYIYIYIYVRSIFVALHIYTYYNRACDVADCSTNPFILASVPPPPRQEGAPTREAYLYYRSYFFSVW